jgi:exoribonuclease R
MKQALYQPENIGHFGLASTCYTHFTSPIRRYPDLIVHRMLDRALRNDKPEPKEREDLKSYLAEAGKHTSERERHAMDAEREMVALKKAQFMMTKMGEEFSGFVNTLANFGFFVELDAYFIEGLVKLSTLTDDDYDSYEKNTSSKAAATAASSASATTCALESHASTRFGVRSISNSSLRFSQEPGGAPRAGPWHRPAPQWGVILSKSLEPKPGIESKGRS